MTASELIATLRRKGVLLRADGDDLKVSAPRGGLSDAELALLRSLKHELLAQLAHAAQ